jgi:hypothetical protein
MAKAPAPEREELAYWTALKPGDYVSLSDWQSFAEAGSGGLDYKIRDIRRIAVRDAAGQGRGAGGGARGKSLAEYHVHELERSGSGSVYLVIVAGGLEFELRVYFAPAAFATGSRDQLVDLGQTWLFLPPPNPDDFISSELEFAPFPDIPALPEAGQELKRQYAMSGFGKAVYGSYEKDGAEIPVIVVEYSTDEEGALNPLVLVLEEGWMDGEGEVLDEGGLVTTLVGCPVERSSVEVFPG